MINYIKLYQKIQKYRVTKDNDLPFAYQQANPQGRPLHNDWTIPWLPSWLQPWGKIPRMRTAYLLPMPTKQIAGNVTPRWFPAQKDYPLVPGTEIKELEYNGDVVPHVFGVDPYLNAGQWSIQAVWLDGEWIECYHTSTKMLFGRKLSLNHGLRPDITLGDFMFWFPEINVTWTK